MRSSLKCGRNRGGRCPVFHSGEIAKTPVPPGGWMRSAGVPVENGHLGRSGYFSRRQRTPRSFRDGAPTLSWSAESSRYDPGRSARRPFRGACGAPRPPFPIPFPGQPLKELPLATFLFVGITTLILWLGWLVVRRAWIQDPFVPSVASAIRRPRRRRRPLKFGRRLCLGCGVIYAIGGWAQESDWMQVVPESKK